MTYNELKKLYPNYTFKTSKEEWIVVEETKGLCIVEYNIDDVDEVVYFDVFKK